MRVRIWALGLAAAVLCSGGGLAETPFVETTFTLQEGSWMNVDVSPDGATIVFDLLNDIYTLPATGGVATLIHGGPAGQRSPRFSADGRRIAFISDASGADNVWSSDIDGANARQISRETVHEIMGPAWAPDGRKVAAAKSYAAYADIYTSEIHEYDLAGGDSRQLVATPPNRRDVQEARYAPGGAFLYYTERLVDPIVYQDANHINFAIKRRHLESGRVETVVSGFGSATTPQISRDGRRLAFVRRVAEKTVLFVLDLETGEQIPALAGLDRDLHADFFMQEHYYPAFGWFPDNRHVAIWRGGKIVRVDTADGGVEDIPFRATATHRIMEAVRFKQELAPETFPVRIIRHLAADPSGQVFLFRALGQLWRQEGAAGAPSRLTGSERLEHEPAWSADGRSIAYVIWDDEAGSALVVRPTDGDGETRTLHESSGVIREPAFAPDGKTIVFRIQDGEASMGGYRARPGLYLVAAEGGPPRLVTDGGVAPRFTPDGARITYVGSHSTDTGSVQALRSVKRDGSEARDLAIAASPDTHELRISPDQRWLAFKEAQQYYVMPFEGGEAAPVVTAQGNTEARRLTEHSGYELSWAPDSARLTWVLGPELFAAGAADGFEPKSLGRVSLTAKTDVPEGRIAFTNARLITMRGEEVIERGTVVVAGNRIADVGPSAEVPVPSDALVIDATGKTIMPGLFDAHGHIECCYLTGATPKKQPTRYAALAFGVTTNFDPYSTELTSYESKEMTMAGLIVGPRWMSSGAVIYGRAGKADTTYTPIETVDDARAALARKHALGASIIKSYRQPARSQRRHLITAARETGIMVDAEGESHFSYAIGMILDGHTNIEHNLPVATYYDDLIRLFAASGASHTPTLVVTFGELFGENYIYQTARPWEHPKVRAYVQEGISGYSPLGAPGGAPPYVRGMTSIHVADELWDIGFRSVARSVKKLDDAGVLINAGSHGQIAGIAQHWEMQLMAEGGMAPLRVLRTSTINPAMAYGMDAEIGSLEPGKLADLIVLDRNPLEDIRNTNSVRYTMLGGRLYDSLSMDEIGNHPRPRSKFYWELSARPDVDWNEAWAGQ
ncbi:MAG: amidohydrolase family protein [Sphingomonadales bacterium]|nr:amidohydrolase family protein [Sphingomonadales bacterium]